MSSIIPAISSEKNDKSDSVKALLTLTGIILLGLLGTLVYALQSSNVAQFVSFAIIGLMVAGASLLAGALLGFLFGIPRTLQQDNPVELNSANTDTLSENRAQRVNYRANTNLEQISDWLTKILVGVGLTQITVIPEKLQQVAGAVATGLGNSAGSRVFAIAVILFFLICGFLFGYLWTRLFLPGAFRQADLSVLVNRVEKASQEVKQVNKKLEELEKQTELDAAALSLTQRQLNPSTDIPAVTQEQLNDAIKAASKPVKVQIFNQAQLLRSESWSKDKVKMELTIPIFRALTESDTKFEFHRNHGQLGFALKDQQKPDWVKAEAELTKAIEMRGNWEENGWIFYEFNRAMCRINQDEAFGLEQVSKKEVREKILADLSAASQSDLKKIILNDPIIEKWMSQNELTPNDLT
ncbi:MAG: hypothetical protein M3Q33_11960 [Acidobacteriota bacterium]|nr:hypothetical protein [Acidobacteriota bacterium]